MSDTAELANDLARWATVLADGSFEEVLAALEELVGVLEQGQLTLDDSVSCYELGVRLAERCEQFLARAELRVSQLESVIEHLEEAASDAAEARQETLGTGWD